MKKTGRKAAALAMAFAMVMGLAGCSKPAEPTKAAEETKAGETAGAAETAKPEAKDSFKIAVLLPGPTGYFVATKEGIDAAAKENNVTIEYADAQWDASKQLAQAEDFMVKGVDLIALCSVDSGSGEKIVKSAAESKIPVLEIGRAHV